MNSNLSQHEPGNDLLPPVQLENCPFCNYSLEGLPEMGRCPECGFEYDEQTYILRAIMRGTSGMSKSRLLLWLFVVLTAWFGTSFGLQIILIYGLSGSSIGVTFMFVLWCALVIYLFTTSKKHRGHKRTEHLIFYAGGFGPCILQNELNSPYDADITPWQKVDAFTIDKKGSYFQRLRIGRKNQHGNNAKLKIVMVDAGLKCTPTQANILAQQISNRIQSATNCNTQPQTTDAISAAES